MSEPQKKPYDGEPRFLDLLIFLVIVAGVFFIRDQDARIKTLEQCVGNALDLPAQEWEAKCKVKPSK